MSQKYHFIGIGGIGMSGLAKMLLAQKKVVTGSDLAISYVTENLQKAGAVVSIGHSAKNVSADSCIVYTTGINEENPEFAEALRLNCRMLHRSDLLKEMMCNQKLLAVAGTHGKTTTTSLLIAVLTSADLDPSYAVGGMITQLNANAEHGKGEYFIAEADESDGTFLKYSPFGAIVTNVDLDHMNYFKTEESLHSAFQNFMEKKGLEHLFWCKDDVRLRKLHPKGISYGLRKDCDLQAENVEQTGWHLTFDVKYQDQIYPKVILNLVGAHNVLNALAVFGLCLTIGVPENMIRKAFQSFQGIKRRCEKKGEYKKAILLDDYAHHPTEIETTLKGIRSAIEKRRLIAIFQPHRYTRTKDCLGTYRGIFNVADTLFITDIYGADEKPIPGVTHEAVMKEMPQAIYVPRKELAKVISNCIQSDDVVVSLGAGDITKLSSEILNYLD